MKFPTFLVTNVTLEWAPIESLQVWFIITNSLLGLYCRLNVCGDCKRDTPYHFCCEGWTNGTEDGSSCLTRKLNFSEAFVKNCFVLFCFVFCFFVLTVARTPESAKREADSSEVLLRVRAPNTKSNFMP